MRSGLMNTLTRAARTQRSSLGVHSSSKRFAGGGPSYHEPTGYLFAEKAPAPGQKRVKEEWENMYYIGMFGTMGLAAVLLYYKPDTSIQTWATEEAKKRLEAKGEMPTYTPSPGGGR